MLASKDDKLEFSFNAKGMNAILNGLAEAEFVKVMHLQTAIEMWDKLISSHLLGKHVNHQGEIRQKV